MAEGRARDAWAHTSALLCLVANCNRDPKKRHKPFTPDDFNPMAERRQGEQVRWDKSNRWEVKGAWHRAMARR